MTSEEEISAQYVDIWEAEPLEKIELVDWSAIIALAAIVGGVKLNDKMIIGR